MKEGKEIPKQKDIAPKLVCHSLRTAFALINKLNKSKNPKNHPKGGSVEIIDL